MCKWRRNVVCTPADREPSSSSRKPVDRAGILGRHSRSHRPNWVGRGQNGLMSVRAQNPGHPPHKTRDRKAPLRKLLAARCLARRERKRPQRQSRQGTWAPSREIIANSALCAEVVAQAPAPVADRTSCCQRFTNPAAFSASGLRFLETNGIPTGCDRFPLSVCESASL